MISTFPLQVKRRFLYALLWFSAFLAVVRCAEWSKMKKCSDLGFCRRHRARIVSQETIYSVPYESVALQNWKGNDILCGMLLKGKSQDPSIKFGIAAFSNGIYRVLIDDASTPLHKRYSVNDVIVDSAHVLNLTDQHVVIHKDRAEISVSDGPSAPLLVVTFNPFRVDLLSGRENPVHLMSLNGESLLRFETHREKPTPTPNPTPSSSSGLDDPTVPATVTSAMVHSHDPEVVEHSTSESQPGLYEEDEEALMHEDNSNDPDDQGRHDEEGLVRDLLPEDGKIDEENINSLIDEERLEYSRDDGSPVSVEDDGIWEESFQSHHDPKVRGPESVGMDISFPFAEHLYGIPERTSAFSLGHTVRIDGSAASEPYRLYNLDVFEFELNKPLGLYGSIPILIARSGVQSAAILWLNSAETYVDIFETNNSGRQSHWFSETGVIDVYLMSGPISSDVFRQYLYLTGTPAMPQRFALGYHQCRWNYRDEPDVRAVDGEFDRHEIPYDVMWLDIEHTDGKRYFTWDMTKFPDPTLLQKDLAARGRKMVTIIDPHIKRDPNYIIHKVAEEMKFYVQTPEGKSFDGWCWPGSSSYYDFTCPAARDAWAARFNPTDYPHFSEHLYTWVDMNEPSVFSGPEGTMPKHMVHANSVEHRDVHNQYGFYVQMATHEGLLRGHGGNDRPFVLSRSFFAGSQRFGAIWTGDNTAAWDHLESSARMLLPLQISGMVFSGADVGGFFGNPSAELLVRWYQVGAFQPFFRGHGHLDTNRREPWLFGVANTERIALAIRTRYSYLPLWYTLMAASALGDKINFDVNGGGPPMRPLWWEFPEDRRLDNMDDEWLVGPSILVAPVLKEGAVERTVYLPGSEPWYDVLSPTEYGQRIDGGSEITVSAPLERLIAYHRGGSIIPKQERRRRSSQAMAADPFTLVVALDSERSAVGELFLDDGRSFNYSQGSYALRKFSFRNGALSAETVCGSGTGFIGEDAIVERVVILGYDGDIPSTAVIRYSGEESSVTVTPNPSSGVLVVRMPNLPVAKGNWVISLID